MAAHGQRVYRAFREIVGGSAGFTRTGMLFGVDPRDEEMLAGNVAVGRAEGVETHVIDAAQVAEIDGRVVADDLVWCYEPGAGHCDPYLVTAGLASVVSGGARAISYGQRQERLGPGTRPGPQAPCTDDA